MTYQINHLKLPILPFLGILCAMWHEKRNEPKPGNPTVKLQNEPNFPRFQLKNEDRSKNKPKSKPIYDKGVEIYHKVYTLWDKPVRNSETGRI